MSILDNVISATQAGPRGPRVIAEQHDTGKVNYGGEQAVKNAGGRRPSEPWDASEYGITLAQAQAKFDAAQTPEARELVIAELKQRALQRASLDVTGGRVNAVFGSGKSAWHGLGVTVDGTMTAQEVIDLVPALRARIGKRPMYHRKADGSFTASTDIFETYREDTEYTFGQCGPLYTPIQSLESFSYLDGVISEFGARYESAGSLFNGEQVWILAHLPQQDFRLNGSTMKAYAAFIDYRKQGKAARCFATNIRLECFNTCRIALNTDAADGLTIRHSGNLQSKKADARKALGLTVNGIGEFREQAEFMARTPARIEQFAPAVLDLVCEVTQAQVSQGADTLARSLMITEANADFEKLVKKIQRQFDKRENIMEQVIEATQASDAPQAGTLWSGYNAFTRVATHGRIGKESRDDTLRAERRFESVLTGERDQMSQAALSVALATAN